MHDGSWRDYCEKNLVALRQAAHGGASIYSLVRALSAGISKDQKVHLLFVRVTRSAFCSRDVDDVHWHYDADGALVVTFRVLFLQDDAQTMTSSVNSDSNCVAPHAWVDRLVAKAAYGSALQSFATGAQSLWQSRLEAWAQAPLSPALCRALAQAKICWPRLLRRGASHVERIARFVRRLIAPVVGDVNVRFLPMMGRVYPVAATQQLRLSARQHVSSTHARYVLGQRCRAPQLANHIIVGPLNAYQISGLIQHADLQLALAAGVRALLPVDVRWRLYLLAEAKAFGALRLVNSLQNAPSKRAQPLGVQSYLGASPHHARCVFVDSHRPQGGAKKTMAKKRASRE